MKKIFTGISTLIITCMLIFSGFSAEAKAPDFKFVPITADDGSSDIIIDDIQIKSDKTVGCISSFDGKNHSKFGKITEITDSLAYDEEEKITYKSHYVDNDIHKQSFKTVRYDTYTFEKYVDMPIKTVHSRKVAIGEVVKFRLQTTSISSESIIETSTRTTNRYLELCGGLEYNVGVLFL